MMETLIEILHKGKHSLVVFNGEIHTYDSRGLSNLYHLYTTEPNILRDADIADKVVGKGAAALMVLGKVRSLHADVISNHALKLLESSQIKISYTQKVDNIINRQGTGICPVETQCLECKTAEECLPKITQFISRLKTKTKND